MGFEKDIFPSVVSRSTLTYLVKSLSHLFLKVLQFDHLHEVSRRNVMQIMMDR